MTRRIYCSYVDPEQLKKYPPDWEGLCDVAPYNTGVGIGPQKINNLHDYWSDYVCMYDVWKNNLKTDFVGFEQYARRLDYKMLVTDPELCNVFHRVEFQGTVADMYAFFHDGRDIVSLAQLLIERDGTNPSDPLSNPYVNYLFTRRVFYSESTFFMSWEKFTGFCELAFPVLLKYDEVNGLNMNPEKYAEWTEKRFSEVSFRLKANATWKYQRRIFGYLAERLLSAYIYVNFSPNKIVESSSDHTDYETFIQKRVKNGDYDQLLRNLNCK